ncbi:MAG: lactoylglutathione lyase [Actinobacteria bacterium]|nr:lactoylglutathione lyase [Actinomycetota bacterium]
MRLAHTMIRVTDLERSLDFYTRVLGMTLFDRMDFPAGRFTLAFVGFADQPESSMLELTYNWDTHEYDRGNGYGHLAIAVADVRTTVEAIRERGGTISREPKAMNAGTTVIAFVEDPDGYPIELVPER